MVSFRPLQFVQKF